MQPGQVFNPGQSGDDASNDNTSPVPDTPRPDEPTPPPAPTTDQLAQDITPPPAQPPAEEEEQVTPSAGAPAEAVPEETEATDQSQPPEEEQSSDDQNRGDTTPTPTPPPAGGAGVASPQDVNEQVARPDGQTGEPEPDAAPTAAPPPPPEEPASDSGQPEPESKSDTSPDQNGTQFSWEASEYIEHHHSPVWYISLGALTLGFMAFLAVVLKEILSAIVVLLMAVSVVVYAHRKPRSLQYQVSSGGINIGSKFYGYNEFKSFAVVGAQSLVSIELDPIKRFMPRLSMLIDQKQAPALVDILNQHLPHEDRDPEFIDRLAHSLKF